MILPAGLKLGISTLSLLPFTSKHVKVEQADDGWSLERSKGSDILQLHKQIFLGAILTCHPTAVK